MSFPQGNTLNKQLLTRIVAVAIAAFTFTGHSSAQLRGGSESKSVKNESVANGLFSSGDDSTFRTALGPWFIQTSAVTCKNLNDSSEPQYAHITEEWEMKIDVAIPNGTFYLVNGGGVQLDGGMTPNPNLAIIISSTGSQVNNWALGPINFLDRAVSAIIVKGGNGNHVYTYPNLSIGDIGPFTTPPMGGTYPDVSHVVFCMEPFTGPSASTANISGRALTPAGVGISGARIEVMNLSTGATLYATTNPFGYYTVEGLEVSDLYMATISHKRYDFVDGQRTFTLETDLVGVDFVSTW